MNITEFRKEYPDYDHVDDLRLSESLHSKFYADAPFYKFADKFIGIDSAAMKGFRTEAWKKAKAGTPEFDQELDKQVKLNMRKEAGEQFIEPAETEFIGRRIGRRLGDVMGINKPPRLPAVPLDSSEQEKLLTSQQNKLDFVRRENPIRTIAGTGARMGTEAIIGKGTLGLGDIPIKYAAEKLDRPDIRSAADLVSAITGVPVRPDEAAAGEAIKDIMAFTGTANAMGKLGITGNLPKGANFIDRAVDAGKIGFAHGAITQAGNKVQDKKYEGGTAALREAAILASLSLVASGVAGAWRKLKPNDQKKAFKILGLKPGASEVEIKQAARKKALQLHPDKVAGKEAEFDELMLARERALKGDNLFQKQDIVYRKKPARLLTGQVAAETGPALKMTNPPINEQQVLNTQAIQLDEIQKTIRSAIKTKDIATTASGYEPLTDKGQQVLANLRAEIKQVRQTPVNTGQITPEIKNAVQAKPEAGIKETDRPVYGTPEHKQYIDKAVSKYSAKYSKTGIVNTDMARSILPGYNPSNIENEEKYFGDAAEITDNIYNKWLRNRKGKGNNKVVFLAGGTGSGKSTVAKTTPKDLSEKHAIKVDSTFTSKDYAFEQIDKAIEAEYTPEILYVYRDPVDAWKNGVWPRWEQEKGHFVKPNIHLITHKNALKNVIAASEKYGDKLDITIVKNQTGQKPEKISIDELKKLSYDIDTVKEQMDVITREKISQYPELKRQEDLLFKLDGTVGDARVKQSGSELPQADKGKQQLTYNQAEAPAKLPPRQKPAQGPQSIKLNQGIDPGLNKFIAEDVKPAVKKAKEIAKHIKTVGMAAPRLFMSIMEPSKALERLHKDTYADVIKAIHTPEAKILEFNEQRLKAMDQNHAELKEYFDQFSKEDLRNFMLTRGKPGSIEAELLQSDARQKLPTELKQADITAAVQEVADSNFKYLKKVAKGDINYVQDYFYGVYKNPKEVDKFIKYWKTTKRFTKKKMLPSVADAINHGLEMRHDNPIDNLLAEFQGIARLEAMQWLKEELMRTGKGVYIDNFLEAPKDWVSVEDPIFHTVSVKPELGKMINNLISTNKITQQPFLHAWSKVNNALRIWKFAGSGFHMKVIAKQAAADSGYLGFLHKKTTTRGFTKGFSKNDPIFKTPEYREYINLGGGHHYSIESQAAKTLKRTADKINSGNFLGGTVKGLTTPIHIGSDFIEWMFNNYIPKVKYAKYLDVVAEMEAKKGAPLSNWAKINIIKEGQNFYGEMNERLFGRSATATSALRFVFLAPGFAEGNYRTIIKAIVQWGGDQRWNAGRSRANIPNSLILTTILSTVGTLILTGKAPKKPETMEDFRDLTKIDTGRKDDRGRRVMIDMLDYDKDYFNIYYNLLRGRPDHAVLESLKRIGGMKAPFFEMTVDIAKLASGEALYDWKGDRVTEITDTWLQKVNKLAAYELRKTEPISMSTYKQARRKEAARLVAFVEAITGIRPTISEKDRRERDILARIYSLKGQQEELYNYLRTIHHPRRAVDNYNAKVKSILESKLVPQTMRDEWTKKLLIDTDRLIDNKKDRYVRPSTEPEDRKKIGQFLDNFQVKKPMSIWDAPEALTSRIDVLYEKRRELNRMKREKKINPADLKKLSQYNKIAGEINLIGKGLTEIKQANERKEFYDIIDELLTISEAGSKGD